MPDFRIEKGQDLNLRAIKLSLNVKSLKEVTSTVPKAMIKEKVDWLVYNADKGISAKGTSDMLKKVPIFT